MFEKGEYIMYGHSGICLVEDITHLNLAGVDRKKLYYVLMPQNIKGSRIYFPIEKENAHARRLITKEEALKLLDEIRDIEEIWVSNEKLREEQYKEVLNSGDYRRWVSIIKTLYQRKQERIAQGKKIAAMDERYMKMAEDALYSELAFVIGKERSEMERFIREHIEKMELEEV